jgi:hypothetical protein
MARAVAADYAAVVAAAEAAAGYDAATRRRTLRRLRRALRAIRSRDYFPPPERDRAQRAVDDLASLVEVAR